MRFIYDDGAIGLFKCFNNRAVHAVSSAVCSLAQGFEYLFHDAALGGEVWICCDEDTGRVIRCPIFGCYGFTDPGCAVNDDDIIAIAGVIHAEVDLAHDICFNDFRGLDLVYRPASAFIGDQQRF